LESYWYGQATFRDHQFFKRQIRFNADVLLATKCRKDWIDPDLDNSRNNLPEVIKKETNSE
jgi:hypothetical protein